MPHDLINAKPVMAAIREFFGSQPALPVHGPDQPALRDHPQAAALGPGAGRPLPRARRVRGARRAPHPLRPHLPDRDAGRPEHRPHLLALLLRAHQRVRVHREPVPQGEDGARAGLLPGAATRATPATRSATSWSATRSSARTTRACGRGQEEAAGRRALLLLPVGLGRGQVHDRAGQHQAGRRRRHRRRARLRPEDGQLHAAPARGDRLHRRLAQAARLRGRLARPLPGERRRQPRPDGLQHAAPGRAPAPLRGAAGGHGHGAHHRQGLGRRGGVPAGRHRGLRGLAAASSSASRPRTGPTRARRSAPTSTT